MRLFTQIQTVHILPSVVARARTFAQQVTPTVGTAGKGYADAKQINLDKIRHDHFISKIGEEAVRLVFEQHQQTVKGPDYAVYMGSNKSWDADLYINDIPLAVKTQTTQAAKRYGLSWTFQASPQRRDPILQKPTAWVCFVEANEVSFACDVYPPFQIKELALGEPRLAKLIGIKKAVYADTLPALT